MSLFGIYTAGGPYMNYISIMAVITVVVTVIKVLAIIKKKDLNNRFLELIIMSGSVALALGLLSQMVGITQALEAIREAADVSAEIVMGGAIVSFYAPIWGFIVFIFSMLFYFILKEIIKARKS